MYLKTKNNLNEENNEIREENLKINVEFSDKTIEPISIKRKKKDNKN